MIAGTRSVWPAIECEECAAVAWLRMAQQPGLEREPIRGLPGGMEAEQVIPLGVAG